MSNRKIIRRIESMQRCPYPAEAMEFLDILEREDESADEKRYEERLEARARKWASRTSKAERKPKYASHQRKEKN